MSLYYKIIRDLPLFEKEVKIFLDELSIFNVDLGIDHLGIKFDSQIDVNRLLEDLKEENSITVSSKLLKGRIYRIIKLEHPLNFLNQKIEYIELPDCKPSTIRKRNGFEHVEFFFKENLTTLEEVENVFHSKFPGFNGVYNLNLPDVKDQMPNPTLEIENKEKEFEIKFHPLHIIDIVNLKK